MVGPRVYIWSGEHKQSAWLAHHLGFNGQQWTHVMTGDELRGTTGATVLLFGTYYKLPERTRRYIEEVIMANRAVRLWVSDR